MKIYYHEKEKIVKLLKNPKREKRPIDLFLRNRDTVQITPEQLQIITQYFGDDYKKMKPLFANKDNLYGFFKSHIENIKKINTKRNRRK